MKACAAGGSGSWPAHGDDAGDGVVIDALPHGLVAGADDVSGAVIGVVQAADTRRRFINLTGLDDAIPAKIFDGARHRPTSGRPYHSAAEAADRDREGDAELVHVDAVDGSRGGLNGVGVHLVAEKAQRHAATQLCAGDVRLDLGNVGGGCGECEGKKSEKSEHGNIRSEWLRTKYSKY